ncbi:MAG: Amidase [Proteobacteria bacterium]|nr:Amidase [Pseudomonadota bacterium]
MSAPLLTLDSLRSRFARHPESLIDIMDGIEARFAAFDNASIPAALSAAARDLLARCPDPSNLPLWGMPYVVGANIDVVGLPTSTGVPALDFEPDFDAVVVERLRAAGALLVGKAPVDPLGLDASAAGVAAAIAAELAVFGIASDRTGAACIQAAGSGVVVIKPSPGRVVPDGLFATAHELDGVVILASDLEGGATVRRIIERTDEDERRAAPFGRLGLLGGTSAAARCVAERLDLATVAVEEALFVEVATLMGEDAWLVLRLDDVAVPLAELPEQFPSRLRKRLNGALGCSSCDLLRLQRRLSELRNRIEATFADCDLLFVPPESNLTGFLNPCGLAAVAMPDLGTLIAPSGSDDRLADAAQILATLNLPRSTRPIDILASSPLAHR